MCARGLIDFLNDKRGLHGIGYTLQSLLTTSNDLKHGMKSPEKEQIFFFFLENEVLIHFGLQKNLSLAYQFESFK